MTRKNNPWLSLVALVLLAVILVWTCTGCQEAEAATTEPTTARFTAERYDIGVTNAACIVITDTETSVQYLYFKGGYGGGLTALQPGEG